MTKRVELADASDDELSHRIAKELFEGGPGVSPNQVWVSFGAREARRNPSCATALQQVMFVHRKGDLQGFAVDLDACCDYTPEKDWRKERVDEMGRDEAADIPGIGDDGVQSKWEEVRKFILPCSSRDLRGFETGEHGKPGVGDEVIKTRREHCSEVPRGRVGDARESVLLRNLEGGEDCLEIGRIGWGVCKKQEVEEFGKVLGGIQQDQGWGRFWPSVREIVTLCAHQHSLHDFRALDKELAIQTEYRPSGDQGDVSVFAVVARVGDAVVDGCHFEHRAWYQL